MPRLVHQTCQQTCSLPLPHTIMVHLTKLLTARQDVITSTKINLSTNRGNWRETLPSLPWQQSNLTRSGTLLWSEAQMLFRMFIKNIGAYLCLLILLNLYHSVLPWRNLLWGWLMEKVRVRAKRGVQGCGWWLLTKLLWALPNTSGCFFSLWVIW